MDYVYFLSALAVLLLIIWGVVSGLPSVRPRNPMANEEVADPEMPDLEPADLEPPPSPPPQVIPAPNWQITITARSSPSLHLAFTAAAEILPWIFHLYPTHTDFIRSTFIHSLQP